MAKFKLLLSCDYEVFGNGSGDVKKCMIESTNAFIQLCAKHNARAIFFVEVCEIWAFQEAFLQTKLDEDWASIIEQQIIELHQQGHLIQLHFHPQWMDYKRNDNNWDLNYEKWRLPKYGNANEILALFKKGKAYLEDLIQTVDPSYRLEAFRAGAYCIQPEEAVLKAMQQLGFKCDSTVAPNVQLQNKLSYFDFRNCSKSPYWNFSKEVTKADPKGNLLEIPIATVPIGLFKNISFFFQKKNSNIGNNACDCKGGSAISGQSGTFSKISRSIAQLLRKHKMFDFMGNISAEEMIFVIERYIEKHQNSHIKTIPIMGIGHPKNFSNINELKTFFNWISTNEQIDFDKTGNKPIWNELN